MKQHDAAHSASSVIINIARGYESAFRSQSKYLSLVWVVNTCYAYPQGVDTFFYVLGGVYLLYVLILILRAYSDLRAMPYLGESGQTFPSQQCPNYLASKHI